MLHLIDALVEWVFGKLRLFFRNALPSTALDLPVAAIDDVDVRSTHVDRLWRREDHTLVALREGTESLL